RNANSTGVAPRATSESATANGIAPPPATRPIGDELSKALVVMAPATPSSVLVSRKAKRPMRAIADEGQDFADRGIVGRQRLHRCEPFGEDAGAAKQLLIKR